MITANEVRDITKRLEENQAIELLNKIEKQIKDAANFGRSEVFITDFYSDNLYTTTAETKIIKELENNGFTVMKNSDYDGIKIIW